jgi:hypothetical protein
VTKVLEPSILAPDFSPFLFDGVRGVKGLSDGNIIFSVKKE